MSGECEGGTSHSVNKEPLTRDTCQVCKQYTKHTITHPPPPHTPTHAHDFIWHLRKNGTETGPTKGDMYCSTQREDYCGL